MNASATTTKSATNSTRNAGSRRQGAGRKPRNFYAFRSVMGVINKLTGMPIASTADGGAPASLPVNQVVLVVGCLGTDTPKREDGDVRGRIALYDFQNNVNPRFRFVVEIGTDGAPKFNTEQLARRISGSGDMAAVNWALGALCSEATSGLFSTKPGMEVPRNSRTLFSSERSWKSCVQMFEDAMSQDWELSMDRFTIPSVLSMVHESRLPAPAEGDLSRIPMSIGREEFRAHAVNHFMQSIATCPSEDRAKLRAEFVFKFIALDRMYCSGSGHNVPLGSIAEIQSWLTRLPSMVSEIMERGNCPCQTDESKNSLAKAVAWLRKYTESGSAEQFHFWIPNQVARLGGTSTQPVDAAFLNPDSQCINALPFQVSESFEFNGEFPGNGFDIGK